ATTPRRFCAAGLRYRMRPHGSDTPTKSAVCSTKASSWVITSAPEPVSTWSRPFANTPHPQKRTAKQRAPFPLTETEQPDPPTYHHSTHSFTAADSDGQPRPQRVTRTQPSGQSVRGRTPGQRRGSARGGSFGD